MATDAGSTDLDMIAPARGSAHARQFGEIAALRVTGEGFLTRQEEAGLLELGIRDFGLTMAEARVILHGVAEQYGAPTERAVERTLVQLLKASAGRSRKVGREQFRQAVQVYSAQAGSVMAPPAIERRVKALMEEQGLEPRRAGLLRLRRWYHKI